MSCLSIPKPDLKLPAGLSIPTPSLPPIPSGGVGFCCTFDLPAAPPLPPITLPGPVMTAIMAAVGPLQDALLDALDLFQVPECPLQ